MPTCRNVGQLDSADSLYSGGYIFIITMVIIYVVCPVERYWGVPVSQSLSIINYHHLHRNNHDDDYDCPVKNIGEYQCHNHYQLTSIIINHYYHTHHDNHDNNYDCLVTRYRGVPMSQLSSIINYDHPNYNPSDNNYHNNLIIMIIITIVQLRDIGEYQCQVNTEPKISLSVFLVVSGENSNFAPDHHHHHNAHYHFVFIIIIIIIYVHHHFVK